MDIDEIISLLKFYTKFETFEDEKSEIGEQGETAAATTTSMMILWQAPQVKPASKITGYKLEMDQGYLGSQFSVIYDGSQDNNIQQSIDRSGGKYGNKGIEAAIACMKMIANKRLFNHL